MIGRTLRALCCTWVGVGYSRRARNRLEEATAMARLISAPLVPTTPLSVLNPFPTASLVLLASFALKAQALNSNAVLQAFTVLTEQHLPLKYHALLAHSQHYNTKATHTGQRVSEEPVS